VKEFAMFKHILIPTDGSELSNIAIANGVKFAKEINAKITGLTVTTPYHVFTVESLQIADTAEQYGADTLALAKRNLNVIKEAASNASIECELVHCISEHPYAEIIKTAQDRGCDIIFQASHGRHGVGALIMGSETQKVLTHSKVPVLVFR
jgi:nucleotide-binding universal stress UspA family protein